MPKEGGSCAWHKYVDKTLFWGSSHTRAKKVMGKFGPLARGLGELSEVGRGWRGRRGGKYKENRGRKIQEEKDGGVSRSIEGNR